MQKSFCKKGRGCAPLNGKHFISLICTLEAQRKLEARRELRETLARIFRIDRIDGGWVTKY